MSQKLIKEELAEKDTSYSVKINHRTFFGNTNSNLFTSLERKIKSMLNSYEQSNGQTYDEDISRKGTRITEKKRIEITT